MFVHNNAGYLISAGKISNIYECTYSALVLRCETQTAAVKNNVSSLISLQAGERSASLSALHEELKVLIDAI